LVLVAAGVLGGCYARARVEPAYVVATTVPAHVDIYPSYYYEGRTVYLIHDHWYYRHPSSGRWVYYRTEPEVLYRQRVTIRSAPPARRSPPTYYRETRVREAPPAYYRENGRRYEPAPPPPKKRRYDRDHDHDHDGDRDDRDRRDEDDRRHREMRRDHDQYEGDQ
jgi:hypothetical protein